MLLIYQKKMKSTYTLKVLFIHYLLVNFVLPLVVLLPGQPERRRVLAGVKANVLGRQAQLAVKQLFVFADADLLTTIQVSRDIVELIFKARLEDATVEFALGPGTITEQSQPLTGLGVTIMQI